MDFVKYSICDYCTGSSETGSGGLQTVGIYDMGPPFPTIDVSKYFDILCCMQFIIFVY